MSGDKSASGAGGHDLPRLGVLIASTRAERHGEAVGSWVLELAGQRRDASFERIDLREYSLPFLTGFPDQEPSPAVLEWSKRIGAMDGFVVVTPEYNHSFPGALKNAIDLLREPWQNKAVGFVSYGSSGGVRAVEHLRGVFAELQAATVRSHVVLFSSVDFEGYTQFRPTPPRVPALGAMLDQLVGWSLALRPLRAVVPS